MATVLPGGVGDYTTLAAAVAAGETYIEVGGQWNVQDDNNVVMTTPNTTIIGITEARARYKYDDAGTEFQTYRVSRAVADVIRVEADGCVIDGINIYQRGTASYHGIRVATPGITVSVKNCIVRSRVVGSTRDGIHATDVSCTVIAENCLFSGWGRAGIRCAMEAATDIATTVNVTSCTFQSLPARSGAFTGGGVSLRATSSDAGSAMHANIHNCMGWIGIVDDNGPCEVSRVVNMTSSFACPDTRLTATVTDTIVSDDSFTQSNVSATGSQGDVVFSDTPSAGQVAVMQTEPTVSICDATLIDDPLNLAKNYHTNASGAGGLTIGPDIDAQSRPMGAGYEVGHYELYEEGGAPTVITPDNLAQLVALSVPTVTFTPTPSITISPANMSQVVVLDAGLLASRDTVAPDDSSQVVVLDATALGAATGVNPAAMAQAVVLDAGLLASRDTVAPNSSSQAVVLDASQLTLAGSIYPVVLAQSMALDAGSLASRDTVAPNSSSQAVVLDAAVVLATSGVTPDSMAQVVTLSESGLAVKVTVEPDDCVQATFVDGSQLLFGKILEPDNLVQLMFVGDAVLSDITSTVRPDNCYCISTLDIATLSTVVIPYPGNRDIIIECGSRQTRIQCANRGANRYSQ